MSIAKLYRVKDLVNYPARAGKVYVDRSGRTRTLSHREVTTGLLNISESMLWKLVKRGDFPTPTYITASMPTWSEDQINEWLASKNRAA
ncbi:MAG: AlpA family phage regulatory protein [Acinetobacter sp.]